MQRVECEKRYHHWRWDASAYHGEFVGTCLDVTRTQVSAIAWRCFPSFSSHRQGCHISVTSCIERFAKNSRRAEHIHFAAHAHPKRTTRTTGKIEYVKKEHVSPRRFWNLPRANRNGRWTLRGFDVKGCSSYCSMGPACLFMLRCVSQTQPLHSAKGNQDNKERFSCLLCLLLFPLFCLSFSSCCL